MYPELYYIYIKVTQSWLFCKHRTNESLKTSNFYLSESIWNKGKSVNSGFPSGGLSNSQTAVQGLWSLCFTCLTKVVYLLVPHNKKCHKTPREMIFTESRWFRFERRCVLLYLQYIWHPLLYSANETEGQPTHSHSSNQMIDLFSVYQSKNAISSFHYLFGLACSVCFIAAGFWVYDSHIHKQ